MAGLQLKLDPTGMVAGGVQAENALERVKREAFQAEASLDRMGSRGSASVQRMGAATQVASGAMGRFGPQMQQVGFQVGDFATQVGAGTSAAQALGQQLPQLLGSFGAVGAIMGAVVAVAVPLGAALWNMREAPVKLSDAMDDLADSSGNYAEAAENARQSLGALRGEFGAGAADAKALYDVMRALAELELADKLSAAGKSLTAELGGITDALRSVSASEDIMQGPLRDSGIDLLRTAMQDLNEQFGIGVVEAQRIQSAMDALATANGPAAVADSARDLLDAITATADESGRVPAALRPAASIAAEIAVEALRLGGDLGRGADEAQRLASVDMAGGISAAGAAASHLANEMARAVGNAASLAGAGLTALKESEIRLKYAGKPVELAGALAGARYDASVGAVPQVAVGDAGAVGAAIIRENREVVVQSATQAAQNQQQEQEIIKELSRSGRGKGGSGAAKEAEKIASAYDSLAGSLDPVVRANQEFSKAQETVNRALDAGYISAEQAASTIALASKEMEKAKAAADGAAGSWQDMWEVGGSAIDAMIRGTGKLSDVLKQALIDMVALITKKSLLGSVAGATASDSVGTLITKSLFAGLFDSGGTLPMGQWGIVGERGPEIVRSTSAGAVVTSRVDTAAMMRAQQVEVVGGNLEMSDNGTIMARVRVQARQAAAAGAQAGYAAVRRDFGSISDQYNQDGAFV